MLDWGYPGGMYGSRESLPEAYKLNPTYKHACLGRRTTTAPPPPRAPTNIGLLIAHNFINRQNATVKESQWCLRKICYYRLWINESFRLDAYQKPLQT
jgi:hypothetical protein